MKQIFKALVLVAAAVATLTSCEKAPEVSPAPEEFTLTVNATLPAPDGTKTYLGEFDGEKYPVLWSADDRIRVSQVPYNTPNEIDFTAAGGTSSKYSTVRTLSADNTEAGFEFTFDDVNKYDAEGNVTVKANFIDYLAIYGGSDYSVSKRNSKYQSITVTLPTTQTPAAGQFDPKAALMATAILGTKNPQSSLDLNFKHLAAYAMLNVKDLDCDTETIQSVTITSDNHKIAGQSYWYYLEGTKYSAAGSASYEINVNLASQSVDNSDFEAYFAAIPTVFAAGDKLTFEVTTDANRYVKEVTITAETAFSLAQGKICDFSVDFSGIVAEAPVVGTEYQLVTDATALEAGANILIVGLNSSDGLYYTPIKYDGGYFDECKVVAVADNKITIADATINVFTLAKIVEGTNTYWTLKSSIEQKYIKYGADGAEFATTDDYSEENAQWSISFDSSKAVITNKDATNRRFIYRTSYNRFAAYTGTTGDYSLPYIYMEVTK